MTQLSISIVLPAYNEAEILRDTVSTIIAAMRNIGTTFEILVVENGSTDNTIELANSLANEFNEVQAKSLETADYGAALKQGLLSAKHDIVVNFDCDYYNVEFLESAVALMNENASVKIVVGSKRAPGAEDTRAWYRRLVTSVFSTLLRKGFGLNRSDTHGMKAMRRTDVLPFVDKCILTRDLFDTELILRCERGGLKTSEIPVAVIEQRPARSSIIRRIPRSIGGLIKLWFAMRNVPQSPAANGNSSSKAA